jgi:hypothetical protein
MNIYIHGWVGLIWPKKRLSPPPSKSALATEKNGPFNRLPNKVKV